MSKLLEHCDVSQVGTITFQNRISDLVYRSAVKDSFSHVGIAERNIPKHGISKRRSVQSGLVEDRPFEREVFQTHARQIRLVEDRPFECEIFQTHARQIRGLKVRLI